jgi:hypothetical protein
METTLNIVELIENNPIARLSDTYQNKLLAKIKTNFTNNEQQIFIASFYCYLNYNQKNDFVIDLDNIWKWLGFSQKIKAKQMLEKNFMINTDYKLFLYQQVKQTNDTKGGHNKETFMLNINTFKRFCLKAGTKKADEIHEYYIKLEETLQEVIQEESNELRLQLEQKDKLLEKSEIDKIKIREKTLLDQFPNNTQCVYYGIIDNVSSKNEKLIKFGISNNLKNRVVQHRDVYLNFQLINAFKVKNKLQIENAIKNHPIIIEKQRTITIKNKNYVEILNREDISFTELDKIIKDIIMNFEYSPENYIKILEENTSLKNQLEQKNETNNTNNLILFTGENNRLKTENIALIKKINLIKSKYIKLLAEKQKIEKTEKTKNIIDDNCNEEEKYEEEMIKENQIIITHEEIINYDKTMKILNPKLKDKTNGIDEIKYEKICGSREEVWNGKAYKTTGGLIKEYLLMHKSGKIISKRKCIQETNYNRFIKCGVNKSEE